MNETPVLNGCKFCGISKLEHANRWDREKGWHQYHTPTDAQRKARWKEFVNQREARKRQQVIELTLAGLQEMLVNNKSLLAEMNPEQEDRFKNLIGLAVHKGYAEL